MKTQWIGNIWRFADHLLPASMVAGALMASVLLTWNHPIVTTLLLALLLVIQATYHPSPGDRAAMLAAALLGTPAEIVEVHLGEWTYHAPDLILGVPMWISLIWANLFALFRRLTRSWSAILEMTPRRPLIGHTLAIPIIGLWGAALFLMEKPPLVRGLYAFMILITLLFWHTQTDRLIFLTGAILGAFGEFVAVQLGYWSYYNPLFKEYGVDITLPLDWGLSAVIIHRIASHWHPHPPRHDRT
ncbi:MAG: hypothetical protein HQL84_05255 [Magnetococcales bacterium]|nr:hypothetical protein [Magnetococcales bacterium]MBF0149438.1 hypothetical protein [Magnetococcales bacterium]MBF0171910.1 hypothetical protein [Magnetococcales bacterium]MBF0630485.1 hypothetical protein [Magnetococcales bacterium]